MNDEKHLDPEFQISRYLDGDMGDAEQAEFEARIKADTSLADEVSKYQSLEARISALGRTDPVEDVDWSAQRREIMEVVTWRSRGWRRFVTSPMRVACAAAAVAVLGVGIFLLVHKSSPPQPIAVVVKPPAEPVVRVTVLPAGSAGVRQGQAATRVAVLPAFRGLSGSPMVRVGLRRLKGRLVEGGALPIGSVIVTIGSEQENPTAGYLATAAPLLFWLGL
jgi:anti-sigma factor RsiW